MGGAGPRDKDWLRARGASPVSYRHNFLVRNKSRNLWKMNIGHYDLFLFVGQHRVILSHGSK